MNEKDAPLAPPRSDRTLAEEELLASQEWLIRIRWIAGVSVLIATWVARNILEAGVVAGPLYFVGVGILVYNAAFWWWVERLRRQPLMSIAGAHRLALLQIAADWVAMTYLIHRSGGVESPAILYFFLHIVLASMLLSARATYMFAALGALLVGGTVSLEYVGVLPHVPVDGFLPAPLYRNPAYVGGVLFFFVSTMFVITYLATGMTSRLR